MTNDRQCVYSSSRKIYRRNDQNKHYLYIIITVETLTKRCQRTTYPNPSAHQNMKI